MGTGSREKINIKIEGFISFDYEDNALHTPHKPDMFRQELKLLCMKYGLDYEDRIGGQ